MILKDELCQNALEAANANLSWKELSWRYQNCIDYAYYIKVEKATSATICEAVFRSVRVEGQSYCNNFK